MSLSWYINRLRSMGPAEVAHRLGAKVRAEWSRGRHEGRGRFADSGTIPPELPGLREAVADATPEQRAAIAAAAGAIVDGRFSALGRDWPRRPPDNLFPPEFWRFDPVTGGLWPGAEAYCFDIDFRHASGRGDVKYMWEPNRLQMLQPLAARALLGDDPAPLSAIDAAIASWHAANPPFRGVGWSSGIEVALRAISLLVASSLVGEKLQPATRTRLREILRASAFWLARFPSRFSSANNHLVAELAGEYLIASGLPELDGSGAIRAATKAGLAVETMKQILPDGVGAEQSPSYGAFTVELLLLCAFVARGAGAPFPQEAVARLGRFADFAAWITSMSGASFPIGDDDEGRVLTLCRSEPAYVASVGAAAAAMAGTPFPELAAPQLRNLLLGLPQPPDMSPPTGLRSFEAGGYTVWRGHCGGRAVEFVFDHGPHGYLAIAAHAHADALSLQLWVDGQPVLVDPGTYLYQSGGAWRNWFRSTRAHNTLSIAGADQSIISGPFNWSHKANARLHGAHEGDPWSVGGSHDGYEKRFGVHHERRIEGRSDGLTVSDRLIGRGAPQEAEVSFQLAPDLEATVEGRAVRVSRAGKPVLDLVFSSAQIVAAKGGSPGAGGYVSPAFGVKVPAVRLAWRGPVGEDGVSVRLLMPA